MVFGYSLNLQCHLKWLSKDGYLNENYNTLKTSDYSEMETEV